MTMRTNGFLIILLSAILLAGCAPDSGPTEVANTAANTEQPAGQTDEAKQFPAPETVKFMSAGDVEIVGTYYGQATPKSPAILFLHQWYSDRQSFDEFARLMQKEGFAALAIDGRGFGESIRTKDGAAVEVSSSAEAFSSMLKDVENAFDLLSKRENVDPGRIAVVGSSYGSSQAINFAAGNEKVKAVALLSPGLNYFDTMPTASAAARFAGRPLLLVSSEDDKDSEIAVNEMNKLAAGKGNCVLKIYPGKAHGTDLFKSGSGLTAELKEFLVKNT